MQGPYDIFIRSTKVNQSIFHPLPATNSLPFDRQLRFGQRLVPIHSFLIDNLPVLIDLSNEQDNKDIISVSPLIKEQPCFTNESIDIALSFLYGIVQYIAPRQIPDALAAGHVFAIDELIVQIERGMVRLAENSGSALFALENACINMHESSVARHQIIKSICSNFEDILDFAPFTCISWPTFEIFMKECSFRVLPHLYMRAFISWVHKNRQDQTHALSLLLSSPYHLLSPIEQQSFSQTVSSLYLHGISEALSKMSGCVPSMLNYEPTEVSAASLSPSFDLIATREDPLTSPIMSSDSESEECLNALKAHYGHHDELTDTELELETVSEWKDIDHFDEYYVQESVFRMGAGQENQEEITVMKKIDFGVIPIPDGDNKQLRIEVELNDTTEALDYIRKMKFHFDMEVDPVKPSTNKDQ